MRNVVWILFIGLVVECRAFLVLPNLPRGNPASWKVDPATIDSRSYGATVLQMSSTPQKPLYDGTNYTFPDTTTPDGIAEALEVSFIHACMQLRSGYVDVLKMFIAAAMSSYQFGFSVDEIQKALSECPNESANRPLMAEEVELRQTWYSLVYLTLLAIDHSTIQKEVVAKSIPNEIKQKYGPIVDHLVALYKMDDMATISVDDLLKDKTVAPELTGLSDLERAILLQSMRVATLTLVVVRESLEAGPGAQSPPKPPIKGAFN